MKNMKYILILSLLCFLRLNLYSEEKGTLSLKPDCKTFYTGREHTLTVRTQRLTGEGLNWNLRYAGRTLASGQGKIPANGEVKITFKFPELKEGVVAECLFRSWVGEKPDEHRTSNPASAGQASNLSRSAGHPTSNGKQKQIKRTLYFYYPNPFVGQKEALKKLRMGVWEPSEGEALSEFLKPLEVPFAKVADPAGFDGEVLLVSGLDFDEFPGVAETLLKLVDNGKRVIVLPPFSGTIPGFAEKANEVKLAKKRVIQEFSKKFDTETWNGKAIANTSMKLTQIDDIVALEVREHRTSPVAKAMGDRSNEKGMGFTYCEVRKGKGSMIITTWDIINGAKESPTPVYLLKEMLGLK